MVKGGKRGSTKAGIFGAGGFGGGAIKITATTSLQLDGSISVDGTEGSKPTVSWRNQHQAGAGGAGGSVYITAPTFSGSGTITSNGGMASKGAPQYDPYNDRAYNGGGGGGGRIAIHCTTREFTGTLSSKGGTLGPRFNVDGMDVANQLIQTYYSRVWDKIEMYDYHVGGPGTIFQQCGSEFDDLLILDNGDTRVGHNKRSILAHDETTNVLAVKHLRLLNRARAEIQSTLQLDQLSGDDSGIALSVREHAQFITPASFTLLGGIHLEMAGHLTATRNVEVRENAHLELKPTGFSDSATVNQSTNLIELATNEVLYKNTINRFQFDSVILEDGGSMSTKSASGIKCGTATNMHWNPDAAGCFCRAPYGAHASCALNQFCIDGTCVSENVLGSSTIVTSTTMRIGATTTLGNEVASSLVVKGMLDLTCATMVVTSSGKISGNGKGYSEEEGPGYLFDTTILEYPSPTYGKPGGSHGGIGGNQGSLKFGEQGSCYGSLKSPVTMGSGEFLFYSFSFVFCFFMKLDACDL